MQYNFADMTPENAGVVEPQPAGMGELARLTGVFFEPGKTFADVAERPSWFVPMLLTVLFGLIFCAVVGQRIGWDNVEPYDPCLRWNAHGRQRGDERGGPLGIFARNTQPWHLGRLSDGHERCPQSNVDSSGARVEDGGTLN